MIGPRIDAAIREAESRGDQRDFVHDPQAFEWVCGRVQAHGYGLPLLR